MTPPLYATRLHTVIAIAEPLLIARSEAATQHRATPDKWSPREILGHLIDSASNNHQRFVRAASQDDLIFPGYDQDGWVVLQDYQHAPWSDLVTLWASYNCHLARVMAAIPEAVRTRSHIRHNFDQIAWRVVPATEPTTLAYFMADYVNHLEHHLRQILGHAWEETTPNDLSGC